MKLIKLLFILTILAPAFLAGGEFDSLITNSPFHSSKDASNEGFPLETESADSDGTYELRGVFIKGATKLFTLYNTSNRQFQHIKQGEQSGGITVEMFDTKTNTLHFRTFDNTKHIVRLKDAPTSLQESGIILK